jgi:hypothetical protein
MATYHQKIKKGPLKIQISSQLMKLLAIRLSEQTTLAKSLAMLRYVKNFLLTYKTYAAQQNFLVSTNLEAGSIPVEDTKEQSIPVFYHLTNPLKS